MRRDRAAWGRLVRTLSEPDDQGQRLQTCYRFDGLSNLTEAWAGPTTDITRAECNFAEATLKLQQSSTWDDFGNELSRSDALGRTWQYRYDYHGHLESSQTPEQAQAGTRTTYGYDASLRGLLKSRTVPGSGAAGQRVTWTRNALGQVTRAETKDGSGAAVVTYDYAFDVAHRLESVTDSRTGRTIVYGWTPGGRLSSIALGREGSSTQASPLWRFQYDGTGRLTGISAPNGQTVAMSLDATGRLTEKVWPDGARSSYAWHPEGSLASVTHAAGSRVLFAQSFGFDAWGNRSSSSETHDQTSVTRSYTYDTRDRLRSETTNGVTRSDGFDVFGNRTSRAEGGVTTNYLFDAAHQLKDIQGGASGRLVYDRNGNLKKYCSGSASGTDSDCTGTEVLTLAWDGLNQLIQASRAGAGGTETYAYDDTGRRIGKSVGGSSTHYQYDGPDILAEYNSPAGAPSALYVHGAGMDEPLMRLTGEASSPQAQVAYYVQDGVGSVVAVAQTLTVSNQTTESGAGLTATGSLSTTNYPVGDLANGVTAVAQTEGWIGVVAQSAAVTLSLAVARPVDRVELMAVKEYRPWAYVIETREGGGAWEQVASGTGDDFAAWSDQSSMRAVKRFAPKHASEVRVRFTASVSASGYVWLTEAQVWNAPGQSTAGQRFDAWGRVEQAVGAVPTYGYTGREPDATGLTFYRARYYHPELGRFVSRDPLGLAAGINPYAYAGGNPVLFNDPDGLMAAVAWNSANQYFNDYQVGTRVQGALQFGTGLGMGALGTGVGVTTGWTGLGALGGGALIALGSDQMSAGFQTLVSGKSTPSLLNQGLQAAGASPTKAAWGEAAITIIASGGASLLSQSGRSFVQTAGVADDVFAAKGAATGAESAVNGLKLNKSLASQAQMSEAGTTMAGAGARVPFRDAARIAKEYGGSASDWVKKSSSSHTARDGTTFETHWVENIRTDQRVEFKTKFPGGN